MHLSLNLINFFFILPSLYIHSLIHSLSLPNANIYYANIQKKSFFWLAALIITLIFHQQLVASQTQSLMINCLINVFLVDSFEIFFFLSSRNPLEKKIYGQCCYQLRSRIIEPCVWLRYGEARHGLTAFGYFITAIKRRSLQILKLFQLKKEIIKKK